MSIVAKSRRAALGIAAVAAVTLGAVSLASTPANARVSVSIGIPGGWGYYAPPPQPYYYPYGYPAYGYRYGSGYGGGYYHRRYSRHYRHW